MTPVHRSSQPKPAHSPGAEPYLFEQQPASVALRALLLLSGAAQPGDPALARLSDDELRMLRNTFIALYNDEHTSAA